MYDSDIYGYKFISYTHSKYFCSGRASWLILSHYKVLYQYENKFVLQQLNF